MSVQEIKHVGRILKEISELDQKNVVYVSYYMKLYVVELILKKDIQEFKSDAIGFLDDIESFKASLKESQETDDGSFAIVHDTEGKGKSYILNFCVTLHNDLLQQHVSLSKSETNDIDLGALNSLISGLWCCVDLFSMIKDTWPGDATDDQTSKEMIKKINFTKMLIKKLLLTKKSLVDAFSLNVVRSSSAEPPKEESKESTPVVSKDSGASSKEVTPEPHASPELKESTPVFVDETAEEGEGTNPPAFVDSDAEGDAGLVLPSPPKFIEPETPLDEVDGVEKKPEHGKPLSEQEITAMMDWATLITKAQKHSKFAISAMNYDDVDTAMQELTQAVAILKILQEQQK